MNLQDRQRHALLIVLAGLFLMSLACSVGGGTLEATAIPIVGIPGTLPPVAQVTPSIVITPTVAITPSETPPSGTGPGGCVLSEQYIADVTIPDNTIMSPGAAFLKTWRVQNTGTCIWDTSYQLVFADSEQMGGPAGVNVNNTPPKGNVDISVNLTAPAAAGTHVGRWRLKASNGAIFGALTVVIVVPGTPTPTPTLTATATPTTTVGPWNGHWETNCGSTSCGKMDLVQQGTTVTGTFEGGGVINGAVSGTRLTGIWKRGSSAGSIDWWMGGSGVKWRGNFDAINGWCGHRTGETDPAPCGVGTFTGDWYAVCVGCDGALHIDQDGRTFSGTYVSGTIEGTIDGVTATGTWHKTDSTSGPFTWYLINGQQFNGNSSGANQWCGYRSGSGAPSPCLKP